MRRREERDKLRGEIDNEKGEELQNIQGEIKAERDSEK